MSLFKGVLLRLLIVIFFCLFIGYKFLGFSSGPERIFRDKIFDQRIDVYSQFPVGDDGVVIPLSDLAVGEQKKILEKIILRDPYVDARVAIKAHHRKFLGQIANEEFQFVGVNCHNPQKTSAVLILVFGRLNRGTIAEDIWYAWQQYGGVYNREMLTTARYGGLNGCIVDLD